MDQASKEEELLAKEQRKQESLRYKKQLELQMQKTQEDESRMEQSTKEEQEKAWAKRLEQWRLEEEKQKKLLKEVLDGRQRQVAVKRK